MLESIASILLAAVNSIFTPNVPSYPIELVADKALYRAGDDLVFTLTFKEGAEIHEELSKSLSFHVYRSNPNGMERSGHIIPDSRWVFSRSADQELRKDPRFQQERFQRIGKNGTLRIKGKLSGDPSKPVVTVEGWEPFAAPAPETLDLYFWYCPRRIALLDSLEDYSNPIRIRIEN